MTKAEALEILLPYIDSIYQSISVRPSMYGGRPSCVEAYVMAIEGVVDYLVEETSRSDRYAHFRSEEQFGEEMFCAMFERMHSCRRGYVSNHDDVAVDDAKHFEKNFENEFAEHWKAFLRWRAEHSMNSSKDPEQKQEDSQSQSKDDK